MANENKNYSCCIIGHRKISEFIFVALATSDGFIDLIENRNVSVFKFGYNGEFNDFCYKSLLLLKNKYPHIKLVLYSLNNEIAYTFEEAAEYQSKYNRKNQPFKYKCFDEIVYLTDIDESKVKYSYVLRNKRLIDESDYCMIYYRKNYSLPSKDGKPRNSGTKIAYDYACKQKKKMILP